MRAGRGLHALHDELGGVSQRQHDEVTTDHHSHHSQQQGFIAVRHRMINHHAAGHRYGIGQQGDDDGQSQIGGDFKRIQPKHFAQDAGKSLCGIR